jgi:hypothetical protein
MVVLVKHPAETVLTGFAGFGGDRWFGQKGKEERAFGKEKVPWGLGW